MSPLNYPELWNATKLLEPFHSKSNPFLSVFCRSNRAPYPLTCPKNQEKRTGYFSEKQSPSTRSDPLHHHRMLSAARSGPIPIPAGCVDSPPVNDEPPGLRGPSRAMGEAAARSSSESPLRKSSGSNTTPLIVLVAIIGSSNGAWRDAYVELLNVIV